MLFSGELRSPRPAYVLKQGSPGGEQVCFAVCLLQFPLFRCRSTRWNPYQDDVGQDRPNELLPETLLSGAWKNKVSCSDVGSVGSWWAS